MIPPCPTASSSYADVGNIARYIQLLLRQFAHCSSISIFQHLADTCVWTIFIYFEVPSTFNPVALLNCGYIWCFPWFLGGNKIMPCCIKIRRCCPSSIILLWLHNVGVVGVESLISAEVFSCCGSPSSQWFTEVCCCREVRSHGVNIE